MSVRWRLDSAEARNREAPRSFFIPPREKRAALVKGDEVKLIFLFDPPAADGTTAERLWVEVAGGEADGYAGKLLTMPGYIAGLQPGDTVEFGPAHVAAIAVVEADLGYDVDAYALVSSRIVEDDVRPARVLRDPPQHRSPGESDSGWRLIAAGDDAGFLSDPENCTWCELGWITDMFPEVEPLFRSGEEGTWEWDGGASDYRRIA